ncbi:hypothetical protein CLV30_12574 [Haloactinopolyspora alba]|uniref:Scaffolding protein n=1 Tax=Haloactinopolyspora alba TaxID=648780 RepID=A0A2P8DHJ5_9ACTN|nr:hypothetical protein [Haloactinopolyspora alba]PSK96692.1 hypothetical protein CLV30_12574 [Haloactinopolyspora alba]
MHTAPPTHPRTGRRAIGFRRDGRPIWPIAGGSGASTDPGATPPVDPASGGTPPTDPKAGDPPNPDAQNAAGTPASGAPPADDAKPGDGFKSEESKQAVLADLAKEREARKTLEARFDKLGEAFGVTKPEGGKTDVEQLTDRLTKHEQELTTERQARWRAEIAHEKGLTTAQAARLVGDTRDDLATDADALLEAFKPTDGDGQSAGKATPKPTPKPDPTQGSRGQVDIDAQIAEAEKKGEVRESIRLKNQKAMAARATSQ